MIEYPMKRDTKKERTLKVTSKVNAHTLHSQTINNNERSSQETLTETSPKLTFPFGHFYFALILEHSVLHLDVSFRLTMVHVGFKESFVASLKHINVRVIKVRIML